MSTIQSKAANSAYLNNYESIFGNKKVEKEEILTVKIPKAIAAKLLEAYNFGQFSDDFNQPLAHPIRDAIRELCNVIGK